MKIYLVSRGQYSDYSIMGAFSTRELAQTFINNHVNKFGKSPYSFDEFDIEELEIDSCNINPELDQYFIRMKKDGNVIEINKNDHSYDMTGDYGFDCDGDLYNITWSKTEDQAVKATNELRSRLLAQNLWGKFVKEDPKN